VGDKTITISVVNKDSPFYGKKFAVGESITQPAGGKVTIKEIGSTTVSILADHPLMNKTLYFDVEIVDVQ
jgi:FKBP-type peptidyl-prolyl cis-trans isomerase 2